MWRRSATRRAGGSGGPETEPSAPRHAVPARPLFQEPLHRRHGELLPFGVVPHDHGLIPARELLSLLHTDADDDARTIRGRALARLGKVDELTWREQRARTRRQD